MSDRVRTGLIHHPYRAPAGFEAPQLGVHRAATVILPDSAAARTRSWFQKNAYTYGLHGTPTTFTLEQRIAHLEGGRQTLLTGSGLAAISLVALSMLRQGDELLIPDNAYGPAKALARHVLEGLGVTHRFYDPMDAAALAALIGPSTRLLWVEAPGSVTMEFPDIGALAAAARAAGVPVALDNTWGAGIAFNAFEAGADIVLQALTKYASGGGDVLMGAVTTIDDALHRRLADTHMRLGLGVGGDDAGLVLRSLPSIGLRYEAQDRAARELAVWLQGRTEVARVLHPALPDSPGHAHWLRHCKAAAGLFSIVIDARFDRAAADCFVDALQLFRIGYSWAGPVSLVAPYDVASMRQAPTVSGEVVRFSIGLEAVDDLRADLAQALDAMGSR